MYAMHARIKFFSRGWGPGDTCMYSQGFQGGGGGEGVQDKKIGNFTM